VDLNQADSWLHFDNSTFSLGLRHVNDLWVQVESTVARLANFGKLTHTIQDFYSHSNWVELHQHLSPIPVWDLTLASLPAEIVSGIYPSSSSRSVPGMLSHAELNKDSPCAWLSPEGAKVVAEGPNRRKTLFELAYEAALCATRPQFDRLMHLLPRRQDSPGSPHARPHHVECGASMCLAPELLIPPLPQENSICTIDAMPHNSFYSIGFEECQKKRSNNPSVLCWTLLPNLPNYLGMSACSSL